MGVNYYVIATMIGIIPFLMVWAFRKKVILRVPLFNKNYTYEWLKEEYGYYKIKYNILLFVNSVLLFFSLYIIFNVITRMYSLSSEQFILVVNSKYWFLPSGIGAMMLSYIVSMKIMEKKLGERFGEFLILLYVEKGCLNIKDMIKMVYKRNKSAKIFGNIIALLISCYIFIGFFTYIYIDSNKIIISDYMKGEYSVYSYEDISSLKHKYSNRFTRNKLGHNFKIIFNDGNEISTESLLLEIDSKDDYILFEYVQEKSGVLGILDY